MEQEIESSKNVRLLLDDPASKVICSALKKYNIASDWQQYALWIKYGPPDNIQGMVFFLGNKENHNSSSQ
jgi:hypothetical protein